MELTACHRKFSPLLPYAPGIMIFRAFVDLVRKLDVAGSTRARGPLTRRRYQPSSAPMLSAVLGWSPVNMTSRTPAGRSPSTARKPEGTAAT